MLVLSRKENEAVRIGENVVVRVVAVKGQRVRLAFDAPDDVKILRAEIPVWDSRIDDDSAVAFKAPERDDAEQDAPDREVAERAASERAAGLRIVDFRRQRRKDSENRGSSRVVNLG